MGAMSGGPGPKGLGGKGQMEIYWAIIRIERCFEWQLLVEFECPALSIKNDEFWGPFACINDKVLDLLSKEFPGPRGWGGGVPQVLLGFEAQANCSSDRIILLP